MDHLVEDGTSSFVQHFWDGCEDSDSGDTVPSNYDDTLLATDVERLRKIGICYHEAAEAITSGCMRGTITFFKQFFDPIIFVKFLQSLPHEVSKRFSQIVHSDEVAIEELLQEVLDFFFHETPTDQDLEIVIHYCDIFYSDESFNTFLKNILVKLEDSFDPPIVGLVYDEDLTKYIDLVYLHAAQVRVIVTSILDKSILPFDKNIVTRLIAGHDRDLISGDNLQYLALDKSFFKTPYHTFKKHPAVDKFYIHKIQCLHHVECYHMNQINIELEFDKYLNYIPIIIADIFDNGMTLEVFKEKVKLSFESLNLSEEFMDKILNILNLINELPPTR